MTLFISFNGIVQALQVATSGKRLNNGAWHLVKVEFGSDELRLSVDLNSAYMSWSKFDRVGQYVGVLHVEDTQRKFFPYAVHFVMVCVLVSSFKGMYRKPSRV